MQIQVPNSLLLYHSKILNLYLDTAVDSLYLLLLNLSRTSTYIGFKILSDA